MYLRDYNHYLYWYLCNESYLWEFSANNELMMVISRSKLHHLPTVHNTALGFLWTMGGIAYGERFTTVK